jgi:hypothetical protein
MNNGGLYGEREGWYLPGYDTSSWENRDISAGLPNNTAGVGFFVTQVELDIPSGVEAMISLTFANTEFNNNLENRWRAYIYVNGWMMGKFIANIGYVFWCLSPKSFLSQFFSSYLESLTDCIALTGKTGHNINCKGQI